MEKYRKPDQHYEDQYDRMTIKELKQMEKESTVPIIRSEYKIGKILTVNTGFDPTTSFYERGIQLSQNKKEVVSLWKADDEQKHWMISMYPPPIRSCIVCNLRMLFEGLVFRSKEKEWLYIYDRPLEKGHCKIYYQRGDEYYIHPRCNECGGELLSKNKRTKYKMVC